MCVGGALKGGEGGGVALAVVVGHVGDGVFARVVGFGRGLHDVVDLCCADFGQAGCGADAAGLTGAAGGALVDGGVGGGDGAGDVGC